MVIVNSKWFPTFHRNYDWVCNGLTRSKHRSQTPGLQGKALRKTGGLIQASHCWIKTLVPSENSCRGSSGGCPFLDSSLCSGSHGQSQISSNERTMVWAGWRAQSVKLHHGYFKNKLWGIWFSMKFVVACQRDPWVEGLWPSPSSPQLSIFTYC